MRALPYYQSSYQWARYNFTIPAFELGKVLGKTPIAAKDNSGSVVSFLLVP